MIDSKHPESREAISPPSDPLTEVLALLREIRDALAVRRLDDRLALDAKELAVGLRPRRARLRFTRQRHGNHKEFEKQEQDRRGQEGPTTIGQLLNPGGSLLRADVGPFYAPITSNDEWLTIKDGVPFESISFAHIIKEEGKEFAQKIIDDIRAATVEQCKKLEYGGRG